MRFRPPLGLHMFWMTIRESWKGLLVFTLILLFMFGGMTQMYPAFIKSQEERLIEARGISLGWEDEEEGIANLSWKEVEGALNYTVLESNTSFDFGSFIGLLSGGGIENLSINVTDHGQNTSVLIEANETEPMWYMAVIALEDGNYTGTGIVSTADLTEQDALQELLDNPAYKGLAGGRDIDIYDIRGFMVMEVGSYWALIVGFYVAYLGVAVVSRDVERKSMDVVLSTPISRRRLLLERAMAVAAMSLFISVLVALITVGGIKSIDASVPTWDVASTFLGAWPLLLVIIAWSMFLSVVFNEQKMAMGASFAVLFVMYIINVAALIAPDYKGASYATPFGYYDYDDFMFGEWSAWGDVIVLLVAAAVLVFISLHLFNRKEIPV